MRGIGRALLRWLTTAALLAAGLGLLATPAAADVSARQQEFVYGLNLFNGVDFSSGFIPPSVDTLYLMADQDNVIDPKQTEVYFWPITNEYKADFTSLNRLVAGSLEVSQGGRPVETVPLTDYVVQVDQAKAFGGAHLYVGPAAATAYQQFLQDRADYVKAVSAYTDATDAYQAKLDALTQQKPGPGVQLPTPPNPPAEFTLFSTDPAKGFPLHLAAGTYQIQEKDASGRVVPDSQKQVVVFGPRRTGVGYQIVPQEKWTLPDQADDPSQVVYVEPEGVLYLEPFAEAEFNALAYARLQDPQDQQATANHWTWVHLAPIGGATMQFPSARAPGGVQTIRDQGYKVDQIAGASLGYVIRPVDQPPAPGTTPNAGSAIGSPDFRAFRVSAPADRATLALRLVDARGQALPASARAVTAVPPVSNALLALPVVLPLLLGLSVTLWRREQIASARSLPPEQRKVI